MGLCFYWGGGQNHFNGTATDGDIGEQNNGGVKWFFLMFSVFFATSTQNILHSAIHIPQPLSMHAISVQLEECTYLREATLVLTNIRPFLDQGVVDQLAAKMVSLSHGSTSNTPTAPKPQAPPPPPRSPPSTHLRRRSFDKEPTYLKFNLPTPHGTQN